MDLESAPAPFLELCRLCANSQTAQLPFIKIFGCDGINFGVREKINRYLPIKVESDDGYPQQVCISCVSRLNVCHLLVNTCLQAHNKLQHLKNKSEEEFLDLDSNYDDAFFDDDNFDDIIAKSIASPDKDSVDNCKKQLETTSIPCLQQGNSKTLDVNNELKELAGPTPSGIADPAGVKTTKPSQVVVIVAEKLKLNKHMLLNLVIVNKQPGESDKTSISEKVASAMKDFRNQCNKKKANTTTHAQENPMFTCTSCCLWFTKKTEMVHHFETVHPSEIWDCSNCGERVCGSAEVFSRHQGLHQQDVGTESESELLSSMTCQLDTPVETFEKKTPEFEVFPLGDFQPDLKRKTFTLQANRMLHVAYQHISGKPEIKPKVMQALNNFFEKFKKIELPVYTRKYARVQCNICDKSFSSKYSLQSHIETVHVPRVDKYLKSPCCHCGNVIREDLVAEHIELAHFGGRDLMCRVCDRVYKITGKVQPHMQTESVKPFKCPNVPCKRGFRKEDNLINHMAIKHSKISEEITEDKPEETEKVVKKPEPVLCATCGKVFKEKSALKSHMETHREGTYICELCGKTFSKKCAFQGHKYRIHREKIPCKICGKDYPREYMKIHLRRHSGAQFTCRYCGKLLTTKTTLKYHELRHNGVPRARCPLCNCFFMTAQIMERHKATHKEGEEIYVPPHLRPAQCDICQRVLKSKFLLRQHMYYSHNQGSRYSSGAHGNGALNKNVLTNRLNNRLSTARNIIKKPAKRFCCQYCEKDFKLKTTLLDHESKHEGKRNHSCQFCEKTFFYSGGYYKHLHTKHGIALKERKKNVTAEQLS